MDPRVKDRLVGTLLEDRLRVLERLGSGSYGTVYRARPISGGEDVAVKVLRYQLVAGELGARVRAGFQREGRVMRELRHPHSVEARGHGQTSSGVPFLVMELLEGESLRQLLAREGALAPGRVRAIALQVLDALEAFHGRGVLHRDLKPDNVFLCGDASSRDHVGDHVKVMDFGLAHVTAGGASVQKLTGTGVVLGTPAYMAPEQVSGGAPGPALDLYALGVMLFEALTGGPPFRSPSSLAVMMKQLHEPPPPLVVPGLGPAASGRWAALVARLLARSPTERPASAAEVAAVLYDLRVGVPVGAVRAGPSPSALHEAPTLVAPARRPRRSDPLGGVDD